MTAAVARDRTELHHREDLSASVGAGVSRDCWALVEHTTSERERIYRLRDGPRRQLHLCGFPAFSDDQEPQSGRKEVPIDSHRRYTSGRPVSRPLVSV